MHAVSFNRSHGLLVISHLFCLYATEHLFIKYIVFSEKRKADNINATEIIMIMLFFSRKDVHCSRQNYLDVLNGQFERQQKNTGQYRT